MSNSEQIDNSNPRLNSNNGQLVVVIGGVVHAVHQVPLPENTVGPEEEAANAIPEEESMDIDDSSNTDDDSNIEEDSIIPFEELMEPVVEAWSREFPRVNIQHNSALSALQEVMSIIPSSTFKSKGKSNVKQLASEVEVGQLCSICLENYKFGDPIKTLQCGHFFHLPCITEWLKRRKNCPFCRRSVSSFKYLRRNFRGGNRDQTGGSSSVPVA